MNAGRKGGRVNAGRTGGRVTAGEDEWKGERGKDGWKGMVSAGEIDSQNDPPTRVHLRSFSPTHPRSSALLHPPTRVHPRPRSSARQSFLGARLDARFADAAKIRSPLRSVRTRLYFTSESHLHALLNVLRYGSPGHPPIVKNLDAVGAIDELNYLSTIAFHVYEKLAAPPHDPNRYRVMLALSPGPDADPFDVSAGTAAPSVTLIELNNSLSLADLEQFLKAALSAGTHSRDPDMGLGRKGTC